MDLDGTISSLSQYELGIIGLVVCLGIIGSVGYLFVPIVNATVDSVVFGYDGTTEYSTDTYYGWAHEYVRDDFTYTVQVTEVDSGERVYGGRGMYAPDSVAVYNGGDEKYYAAFRDGYVTYRKYSAEPVEFFGNAGSDIRADSVVFASNKPVRNGTTSVVRPYEPFVLEYRDSGSIILEGATFRKVGESTYNGYAVDVYKKTVTVGGSVSLDRGSVIYVAAESGQVVYVDAVVGERQYEYSVSFENVSIEHFNTSWVSRVTEFESSEIKTVDLQIEERRGPGYTITSELAPKPLELSDTVVMELVDNGSVVVRDTVELRELRYGVWFTEDGVEMVPKYGESENPKVVAGDTIRIRTGETVFQFENVTFDTETHRVVATKQTLTESRIRVSNTSLTYVFNEYYGYEGVVGVSYGGSVKYVRNTSALLSHPSATRPSVQFTTNSMGSHLAVSDIGSNIVFLEQVQGQQTSTGGSLIVPVQSKRSDVTVRLWNDSGVLVSFTGLVPTNAETVQITNIPPGEYYLAVIVDDSNVTRRQAVQVRSGVSTRVPSHSDDDERYYDTREYPSSVFTPSNVNYTLENINQSQSLYTTYQINNSSKFENVSFEDSGTDISVTQQDGRTKVTVTVMNQSYDGDELLVRIWYGDEEKLVEISNAELTASSVSRTVVFNSTNDSFVIYSSTANGSTIKNNAPIRIRAVNNMDAETGYFFVPDQYVRIYSEKYGLVFDTTEQSSHPNPIGVGSATIEAPVGNYSIIKRQISAVSYFILPVSSGEFQVVGSDTAWDQYLHTTNNSIEQTMLASKLEGLTITPRFSRTKTHITIANASSLTGTLTIVYNGQEQQVSVTNTSTVNISFKSRDGVGQYIYVFYTTPATDGIQGFRVDRLGTSSKADWWQSVENQTYTLHYKSSNVLQLEYHLQTDDRIRYFGLVPERQRNTMVVSAPEDMVFYRTGSTTAANTTNSECTTTQSNTSSNCSLADP